jgi:tetratricopeptide (TPR) repeat protein
LVCAAALAIGAFVTGVGWYAWQLAFDSALPTIDLEGADPAVVAAVRKAEADVRQGPRNAATWGELGLTLAAHDFRKEAQHCFSRAEQLDRSDARWPYHQALWLLDAGGELGEATAKLQRAAELCKNGPIAPQTRLAELYLAQDRLDEAGAQFRSLLAREPNNPRVHLGLARLAWARGDTEAARAQVTACADSPVTRKAAHALLAEILQQTADARGAAEKLHVLARLPADQEEADPFAAEVAQHRVGEPVQFARAWTLVQEGRTGEAVPLLQETVRDYPNSERDWILLGRALLQQGALPLAEDALRTAARLAPNSGEGQVYLGLVLEARGEPTGAIACYRRAIALTPGYPFAHFNLGRALRAQGDKRGAIDAYEAAVRCKPDYAAAHAAAGELLAEEGMLAKAIEHLRQAHDLAPEDPAVRRDLEETLQRARTAGMP